ncbi:hypothetical protein AAG906_032414 [Vitis piasezkii]
MNRNVTRNQWSSIWWSLAGRERNRTLLSCSFLIHFPVLATYAMKDCAILNVWRYDHVI